jgi:3-isopropylmalate/(R)-2-methylmalate dehydratase small subunit
MRAFTKHNGLVAPLDRANVDTDQILPKQFLKRIERSGFGQFLFYDWRFDETGAPRRDFVLNEPRYKDASILVAGRNFGCGSSREHAPWALEDYGFRVIIAPSFADIFANNCAKIGLLTIALDERRAQELMRRAAEIEGYVLTVDLENCTVNDAFDFRAAFPIDAFARERLLKGLDDIGLTLQREQEIAAYERNRPSWRSF